MTSEKTPNFIQRQVQRLLSPEPKVETLDLPFETAQKGLKGPIQAIQTPPLENNPYDLHKQPSESPSVDFSSHILEFPRK